MPTKTDRIRFVCEHCDYRARIPAKYDGQTIACPNCKKPSIAKSDEGPATGQTVEIRKEEAQPAGDDKFRFVCADCAYRARIPVKYAGMAIKCPGCGKPQEANRSDQEDEHTGGTVEIRKVDLTAGGSRFLFQCGGCGYRARLPAKYHGQDIKCPGCGTPQTAEAVADPGPSTGSTVNISKVEAAGLAAEAGSGGSLDLDEPAPQASIDLDAPGEDQVEVPLASPVRTATPLATPMAQPGAGHSASSHDLALPVDEVAAEASAAKSYDPFGDQARDAAEADAPIDAAAENLLGELRSASDRQQVPAAAAKPKKPAPARPWPAAPAPAPTPVATPRVEDHRRRGSDRPPAVAGGKKGPTLALGGLLALAVIAAGALGYLYSQTLGELEQERTAHQQTQRALSDEQGAHQHTREQLSGEQSAHSGTREQLAGAKTRIEELDQQLLETKAALNIANEQLAGVRQQAAELRQQVDDAVLQKRQVERQLEALQVQMDAVTETMRKAGHETLELFLEDALKRRR